MVLIVLMALLLKQNNAVKIENRHLILQNDSILSVNIELKNRLHSNNNAEAKFLSSKSE